MLFFFNVIKKNRKMSGYTILLNSFILYSWESLGKKNTFYFSWECVGVLSEPLVTQGTLSQKKFQLTFLLFFGIEQKKLRFGENRLRLRTD